MFVSGVCNGKGRKSKVKSSGGCPSLSFFTWSVQALTDPELY